MTKNSIPKIVADSAIPFLRGVLEPWAEVRYLPGAAIGAEDVRTADALVIRTRTRCNEALLGASSVRLISVSRIVIVRLRTVGLAFSPSLRDRVALLGASRRFDRLLICAYVRLSSP